MMKIHGCKKCQGALVLDKDEFGWYEQCIQCGYTADITLEKTLKKPLVADHIAVIVGSGDQDLERQWKQDKISTYEPIVTFNTPTEDLY